jgi:hypothetical protein
VRGAGMVLILYLGIVFVLVGVIFVVTSVEIVKKPMGTQRIPLAKDSTDQMIQVTPFVNEEHSTTGEVSNNDQDHSGKTSAGTVLGKDYYDVVLYNDDSGSLTGSMEMEHVDPANIKNINRIGRGIAELGDDGVNIRIDKNLYRFDYYRLDNFGINQNYAVFGVKNIKTRHIIIADDEQFPKILMSKYKKFQEV